ncbi:sialidase family protein [Curvibacter sp. APW13]|uniref:sialidase family protein n=1 Tax=Curvibacter sp. APW13 TaxID=3077236 RepID=UPI0028DF57EF|nr:sialidase family protein [Curvibacter sp. APW13]MDT8989606.1 sialidase family protein [Curvibacter sp. APW13]
MDRTVLLHYRSVRLGLWATGVVLAAALGVWLQAPMDSSAARMPAVQSTQGTPVRAKTLQRVAQGDVPNPDGAKAGHAASLVEMAPDDPALLTLFWFSGERESGPQVQIVAAQWLRATQAWTAPRTVVNRHAMGELLGHGIRRLGNPVAWRDAQGRMHLYVVATGGGGWAAARILHLRQKGPSQALEQLQFEPERVLPLSWLWNTSFLVRNGPLPLDDGGMALPVHFELGAKIPAVLRLDREGRLVGMARVSSRDHVLQPALLPLGPQHWLALMRDESLKHRVAVAETTDGGRRWQDLPDLDLPNPDASVAAWSLGAGEHLLAYNPIESGRERLDLARSHDGIHWQQQLALRTGQVEDEFSYPALLWAEGSLWVAYTVDRARLAWQRLAPQETP